MSDPRWDADLHTDGVRRTAARALAWSATSQVARQSLQFIVFPLLATMLDRSDFGLVAMAMVVTGFVMALNDIGARSALQREPQLSEALVAGVFWLNTGLGTCCTAFMALLAWPVALLYDEPRLVGVLLALSPSFLLASVGLVSFSLLQRRLEQKRLAVIELIAAVAGGATALTAAWNGAGAYAVVLQLLVGTAVLSGLALLLAPVPAFAPWRFADVRPVIRYSVNLALFTAVNAVARNADYLLLGRFAGAEATGLYYLAYRLVVDPVSQAAAVIGRVALPVLAAVQGVAERLREGYLKVVGTLATATFPATLGVLVVRHELLEVLGEEWAPVAWIVVLLLPVGLLQAVLGPLGFIYQVRGRTDLMFRVGAASAAGLVLGLSVGVSWGAAGVAAAYSISFVLMAIPILIVPLRLIDLSLGRLARELTRPLAAASAMAVLVHLARPLVTGLPPLAALLALIALGVATQFVAVLVLDRARIREVRELLMVRR